MALPTPKRLRVNAQLSGNRASQLVQKPASQLAQKRTTEYSITKSSNKEGSVADAPNSSEIFEEFKKEFSPEEKKKAVHPGSSAAQDFVSTFADTHDQLVASLKDVAQKSLTKKRHSTSDYEYIWKAGTSETFPKVTITGWGVKERSMMAAAAKKSPAQNTSTFAELVDWSVRNWPQIKSAHFKWMDNAPTAPSLTFFTSDKLHSRLAGAKMDGDIQRFANSANCQVEATDMHDALDGGEYKHGFAPDGHPKTWTGKIVSLEVWHKLTEWEKHGPNGRHWSGITRTWDLPK